MCVCGGAWALLPSCCSLGKSLRPPRALGFLKEHGGARHTIPSIVWGVEAPGPLSSLTRCPAAGRGFPALVSLSPDGIVHFLPLPLPSLLRILQGLLP